MEFAGRFNSCPVLNEQYCSEYLLKFNHMIKETFDGKYVLVYSTYRKIKRSNLQRNEYRRK